MPLISCTASEAVILSDSAAATGLYHRSDSEAVILSDSAAATIFYHRSGSGGVTLGGRADTRATATLTISQGFSWNIHGKFQISKVFSWQSGSPPLNWYQVEGKCIKASCDHGNLQSNDARCAGVSATQKFLAVILARNLSDVCQQLSDSHMADWPILSIKIHSRPAEPAQIAIDAAKGIDHTCDVLTEVPFCQVPKCMTFCVDAKGIIHAKMGFTAGVIKNFKYTGSGSAHLGGSADIVTPWHFRGSGGVLLGGAAYVTSTNWEYIVGTSGAAGIVLAGHAGVVSSSWHYTGSGGIITGGKAQVKSQSFQYAGSGLVLLGGSAAAHPKMRYHSDGNAGPGFAAIRLDGLAKVTGKNFHFSETGSGGVILGGSAIQKSQYWHYQGSGGVILGGSAIQKSQYWHYQGIGGIVLGGVYRTTRRYTSSGGILLGGTAPMHPFYRPGVGGLVLLGGHAMTTAPSWHFVGSGSISLGGSGPSTDFDYGTFKIKGKSAVSLAEMTPIFGDQPAAASIAPIVSTVINQCQCPNMSSTLYFTHNLASAGMLNEFLQRNSLSIPSTLTMSYDRSYEMWKSNIHYRGRANDGGTEDWTLLFTWQCTNQLGSYDLGSSVWAFGMYANKRLSSTGRDGETRILMSFSSTNMCSTPKFNLKVQLNTNTKSIQTKPAVVLNTDTLYDQIGMFSSPLWLSSPVLLINLSAVAPATPGKLMNITPFVEEASALP